MSFDSLDPSSSFFDSLVASFSRVMNLEEITLMVARQRASSTRRSLNIENSQTTLLRTTVLSLERVASRWLAKLNLNHSLTLLFISYP